MMMKTIFPNVLRTIAALVLGVWLVPTAHARPTPPPLEDPAHWATVTHPGNAPYVYEEPFVGTRRVGQVNYEYRISKTEVTAGEWIQFVNAYKPFIAQQYRFSSLFTSFLIRRDPQPDGTVNYTVAPGADNYAIEVGFRFAARYCNWLHNGKVNEAWAFESGVYDTSTFGDLPNFGFTDQAVRSPGSKFWMPNENEWIKAGYFDPHKNGQDMPGYWQFPTTSDTAPVSGPPGVGQTSGGEQGGSFPVGAYANVTSPWGLFDVSGSETEWVEDVVRNRFTGVPTERLNRGSHLLNSEYVDYDKINGRLGGGTMQQGFATIRLASIVPSPTTVSGAALVVVSLVLRRRR
jgi:formylglycine-generating enzyme required for sulfatase activity